MREEEAERIVAGITSDIVDEFLAHHGVKGMKWGVRKNRETAAQKQYRQTAQKHFRDATSPILSARVERSFGKGLTQEEYNRLGVTDTVLRKGHTLNRVTKDPTDHSKNPNLYVSTNKRDAEIYRAVMPANKFFGDRRKSYGGYYEVTLKATTNLKSPSDKARVDAFINLMDTPQIQLKNGKTMTGREWLKKAGYAHEAKKLDSFALGLRFYHEFAASQGLQNSPLNSAYFKSLSDKGYNAVKDDHDRNIVSHEPWIVMDAHGNLKNFKVRELKTEDVLKAQLNLKVPLPSQTKKG